MIKEETPTAEEEVNEMLRALGMSIHKDLKDCIIDTIKNISKLHVKAALKAAYDNHFIIRSNKELDEYDYADAEHFTVDKQSILNAYSLNNIK